VDRVPLSVPNQASPAWRRPAIASILARAHLCLALFALTALAACARQPVDSPAEADPRAVADAAEARAHAHMDADPPEWDQAYTAFEVAAEAGSGTAMSHLGWMYEEGHGVAVDGERAAHWYARAARAGAHDFAVKLGWMYLAGDGVARDRQQAEGWFREAIDAGHQPGRIALASVLVSDAVGGREPARVAEARELLEVALDDGYATASYFLARLYIEGIGGHPVDRELAARYTRIGAESGDARMQGWLAWMHAQGEGVARDRVEAAKWANLAAADGDAFGNDLRLALEAEMPPDEIRAARERAVNWALARR